MEQKNKNDVANKKKKKIVVMWKIVGTPKVSVLYIYIDDKKLSKSKDEKKRNKGKSKKEKENEKLKVDKIIVDIGVIEIAKIILSLNHIYKS